MAEPRRVRTQAERDADGTARRAAGFQVVYVPPTPVKPEVHTCDLPQSASAVYARDLELPKMGTVAECVECGQRWVADWHSHMQIWSPLPRRRWWHRYTRRSL